MAAMRNFWLNAEVDGRQSPLAGGPRSRTGQMKVDVFQRCLGESKLAVSVRCFVNYDGKLLTQIFDRFGKLLDQYETDR